MDKSALKELYNISRYGDLWKVSCAVEKLRKQAQNSEVNEFFWQTECKLDKLRMDLEHTILELQEYID
jgi:hypothetical protein